MNNIEKTVIDSIARFSRLDKKKITLNSTLYKDLGLLGDDAVELFQAFQKEFEVDLSEFQFDRHFYPEPGACTISLFKPSTWRLKNPDIPITVSDMILAAKRKKWEIDYQKIQN